MIKRVGLTGNLNSGYISAAELFKLHGAPIFDADIALKFLLNYREDIIKNIKIQFGSSILNKGVIDHTKFNTTEKFDRLVDLAEPEIFRLFENWIEKNKYPYVIFKYSILFERNLKRKFDYIVTTFKPVNQRAMDLSIKSGRNYSDTYSILESEMDDLTKNQKSDWVIHNYDNLSLLTQTKHIHDQLISKSGKIINDFNSIKNILS